MIIIKNDIRINEQENYTIIKFNYYGRGLLTENWI